MKSLYELVAEAKDQGLPSHSSRVAVRIRVTDVNDNAPILDDPQEDVISVREEQPPGTEVVRVRAVDPDDGYNATLSYSILKGIIYLYLILLLLRPYLLLLFFVPSLSFVVRVFFHNESPRLRRASEQVFKNLLSFLCV